ncbi:TPA: N-6 DNA methylase [Clostridioides difficile]|uniref:HsdM family class I SAM-dependent methyltransferase n=1 Tax=Clostridioides difficile TaxID=1496 RepID=UPI0004B63D3E|nr:N-6 DNA methylase [Clostridioides difficile]MCI4242052.1 SAM-dependent methyltransferase [Clostridioides difficile]MDB9599661.1 N-6 DNA methylase [Clostridioides difficile]MDV9655678.1 N-6 DNA methylase [Clostridioides difficile]MDW0103461.1 N-6 DNA methylase [Clostridioides difficile]MDW0104634.1 N-6 DNA methylase [Clostridioides difficile]
MTEKMRSRTEDEVRDEAKLILGFDKKEKGIKQGTGQITTFNQLGFKGINYKPDGWYLPDLKNNPAIILETKSEKEDLENQKWVEELFKNIDVVNSSYSKVIGILYNGNEVRVFKNFIEEKDCAPTLQHKNYYINLFTQNKLDKDHIYEVTQKINNSLHFDFGMTDLQDRMIFTACALVAQRYNPINGLQKLKDMNYSTFHNWIYNALAKAIENDKKQNNKLDVLLEEYSAVRMSITENQEAINTFIDNVCEIAELVNSDYWNGEDVMAIFFNEFNRYRGKADAGQIFTPDHITSFMYRLIDVNMNDNVLDATCGSGAFLVKSMCNMIKEAGGVNTSKAKKIKANQLFGIEMYRKVYALACANMMIHKDGKTNLVQMDAKSNEASNWIKNKKITKVLMNPPYERKYGCMKIVKNVLDNVPENTRCAFILPEKKLEKDNGKKLLKDHTLTTIIKMPENLFFGIGITTSIFIFETGRPQNGRNIIGYYMAEDGLETVKNKGRHDVKDKWNDIENYWITAIRDGNDFKYNTRQIINPKEHLSYQMPKKPFEIYDEDFIKTIMDYEMFKRGIDVKEFNDILLQKVLYGSDVTSTDDKVTIIVKDGGKDEQN